MQAEAISPGVRSTPDDILFRGNFYAEGTYLRTDVAKGVTRNRAGTRVCALTEDFLLGFRKAIVDECGPAAEAVFKSCGRKWGDRFARRFEKEMTDFYGKPLHEFSLAMFQACLIELFSHHGWGLLRLDLAHYDKGLLLVELHQAIMADLVEQTDDPAGTMMAGIFAGFFHHLTGEDLDCVQTTCKACGADASRFIVGLTSRLATVKFWVEKGKKHEEVIAELATVRV